MRTTWLLLASGLLLSTLVPAIAEEETAEELFVRRIAPLFEAKCRPCHGDAPDKLEGDFDLRKREGLLRGGASGEAAVTPGKPDESPLYLAVQRTHSSWPAMPPKEADKLSSQQIDWIEQWIAAGAPWPEESRWQEIREALESRLAAEEEIELPTSGGISSAWTNRRYRRDDVWAYQPVRKPATVGRGAAAIDELLLQRMPERLVPAAPAEARVFLRRACFDLTGLPPTPEEASRFDEEFRRDPQRATEQLIERLLASPHYGERMAQHWLDVVRYADSSGLANDYARGNAWRYRDYVVRSFNSDKPYDAFVREQIAGDELNPDDPEMRIAVGFLRMGPWELTGMEVARIARQRFLDDVVNSVGETFLAQPLQCARCHDHKFDPLPTGDYYALAAVFACTQLAERPAPFLAVENTAGFEERKHLLERQAEYRAILDRLDEKSLLAAEAWFAEKQIDPAKWRQAVQQATSRGRGAVFAAARGAMLRQGVPEDQFPPRMLSWTIEEIGLERIANKGLEQLAWELERYEPFALSVYNGRTPAATSVTAPQRPPADPQAGELEQTAILTGGDPFSPAKPVSPGVLSVLGRIPHEAIPESIEGRRKAFASWVASEQNPLTTRAIVNRVWLWHFGQPIAGNPNNFGAAGKRPTHPELLDFLAATLVESGWSIKSLHRLIMTSAAYRRGAEHTDPRALADLDPRRQSYAVFPPRRLSAEELRDAMLAASGELNRALGGIPNRPEIHPEAALQPRQVMGTFAAAWVPNRSPQERHRRSLYALKLRGLADPAMSVFNAPSTDLSCERREESLVPAQAFSLLNGQFAHARSLALAASAIAEVSASAAPLEERDDRALGICFQRALLRAPTAEERALCLKHWREMTAIQEKARYPSNRPPPEVRRQAIEENTGQRFEYLEKLYGSAGSTPDLQPHQCDARTRALADVCLALFNGNEFLYVY